MRRLGPTASSTSHTSNQSWPKRWRLPKYFAGLDSTTTPSSLSTKIIFLGARAYYWYMMRYNHSSRKNRPIIHTHTRARDRIWPADKIDLFRHWACRYPFGCRSMRDRRMGNLNIEAWHKPRKKRALRIMLLVEGKMQTHQDPRTTVRLPFRQPIEQRSMCWCPSYPGENRSMRIAFEYQNPSTYRADTQIRNFEVFRP